MKKQFVGLFIICVLMLLLVGCYEPNAYEEATTEQEDMFSGYFTLVKEWHSDRGATYRIVYANDTGVMYFVFAEGYQGGITPLYNADGTLQIYDGE